MATTLHELLTMEDEVGVLTVTASFTPAELADGGPTAPAEVRAALKRLQEEQDDGPRAEALAERLDELSGQLAALLDPRGSGQGRLLVVGLGSGQVVERRLQVPLPTEVHLGDGPTLRRVLEVADEHQPAGVVLLHAQEALLLEVELGAHEALESYAIELGDEVFADEFYGPSGRPQQRGATHREARHDRVQANLDRFLEDVADGVREQRDEHGWARVVLVGPSHERDVVAGHLDGVSGLSVLHVDMVASGSPQDVMEAVRAELEEDHRVREVELVRLAIDRAKADGAGALGPVDVARALTEGRVHHLLVSPWFEANGYRGADGVIVHEADQERGGADGLEWEPRFVHRMIERAMATDADVTPVDDEAAAYLEEEGQVAALLRW